MLNEEFQSRLVFLSLIGWDMKWVTLSMGLQGDNWSCSEGQCRIFHQADNPFMNSAEHDYHTS